MYRYSSIRILPLWLLGMYHFLLIYFVEPSFRKYIITAPGIILIKYIFLIPLLSKVFRRPFGFTGCLLLITIPLLVVIPDVRSLPYAFYDLISLLIVPVLLYESSLCHSVPVAQAKKILYIIIIAAVLNSVMIIFQQFAGPQHWINQSVDQQYTAHTFSSNRQKKSGIAASPSALIPVAGLMAASYVSKTKISRPKWYNKELIQLIIIFSIPFNLDSRSYSLGILLYLLILEFCHVIKRGIPTLTFFLAAPAVFASFVYMTTIGWISETNRLTDNFDSASSRFDQWSGLFTSLYTTQISIPMINGAGLGATVNSNPFVSSETLPALCFVFAPDGGLSRYICAFGYFGLLHIFARAFLGVLIFANASKVLLSGFSLQLTAGLLYLGLLLFLGAPLYINDSAAGLLTISFCLCAIRSLDLSSSNHAL
jgi:hypothetical protein